MNISEKSKVNNAIGEVIDDVDESPTSFVKLVSGLLNRNSFPVEFEFRQIMAICG